MKTKIRIGTRSSPLAMAQAHEVETYLLAAHPHLVGHIEIVPIVTTGDKLTEQALIEVGGKALFTKEIEEALLAEEIDLAVHSMKDVPVESPPGLIFPCILAREDPRDALITRGGLSLDEFPAGAKVGTASLRRQSQMLVKYPHFEVVLLRGNVGTRLKKIEAGEADITLLALAGLNRLGLSHLATMVYEVDDFIPCVGQGALGLQCREDDEQIQSFVYDINDKDTAVCVQAERAFMERLEGSCRTPMGAYAEVFGQVLTLRAFKSEPDGTKFAKVFLEGVRAEATELGYRAAEQVLFKS